MRHLELAEIAKLLGESSPIVEACRHLAEICPVCGDGILDRGRLAGSRGGALRSAPTGCGGGGGARQRHRGGSRRERGLGLPVTGFTNSEPWHKALGTGLKRAGTPPEDPAAVGQRRAGRRGRHSSPAGISVVKEGSAGYEKRRHAGPQTES